MKTINLSAFALVLLATQAAAEDLVKRGEYLARIMDCQGCHTGGALTGKPDPALHLAGSAVGFGIPDLGVFYPPNLTPDRETGLGAWSEADIVRAVRTGTRPDGRQLVPVMPWPSYAALTDADAKALATYLKGLPPVRHQAPPPVGASGKPAGPYLGVVLPQ
ncbi:c-type cytochrome [Azospirillum sp. TSO22-1]|uniref:c-type cytochrome n=1 Tax=Azospirillum sp. TSO22-1 TaxID=716789 RepID=UPI000D6114F7|nr:c-type cytochrome [Azospirillum sp. TSO22-1]PWC31683.1 cytochrome C [Azospirillum sp. TSO22-1]